MYRSLSVYGLTLRQGMLWGGGHSIVVKNTGFEARLLELESCPCHIGCVTSDMLFNLCGPRSLICKMALFIASRTN